MKEDRITNLRIGWGETNITPDEAVLIAGQLCDRRSEGVQDPLTATVLAIQSGEEHAIFVSCDLVTISNELSQAVRDRLIGIAGINPAKVIIHATHTHTGAEIRYDSSVTANVSNAVTRRTEHDACRRLRGLCCAAYRTSDH